MLYYVNYRSTDLKRREVDLFGFRRVFSFDIVLAFGAFIMLMLWHIYNYIICCTVVHWLGIINDRDHIHIE